eukprot:TRINITY_DN5605_c0_g1_i1.p2 TRINITY_DN5605_c0_g1~~TRINITY_DN5605_c0_g1_i1.p2  ORF type:complete len:131 (+),score=32.29 TRINITY_DN5605_c0_g1_i1:263-655(+)
MPTDGVADQARAAAALVIRQAYDSHTADKKLAVAGCASEKKARVYSGQALLDADAAWVAADEAVAVAKAAAAAKKALAKDKAAQTKEEKRMERVQATCRQCGSRVHRGGARGVCAHVAHFVFVRFASSSM